MRSLKLKANKIYCPLRQSSVPALPEEKIRVGLIIYMIEKLGYPKGSFVIEKSLSNLPHIKNKFTNIPKRRVDILCYSNFNHSLSPFLLIECKAIPLNKQALQQVAGYNYYIGAPFMAITNGVDIYHGTIDPVSKEVKYLNYLPSYDDLKSRINNFPSIRMNDLS